MTPRNFIGWHPRENLHVVRAKDILSSCHGNSSVIPDARRPVVNFLLLLVPNLQPFIAGSKLFNWRGWCRHSCCHEGWEGRERRKDWIASVRYTDRLVPITDKGSSFLFLIREYMSLLNFVVISARREHLLILIQVSTKKAILTNLTLTLFSFNLDDPQHVGKWAWT